MVGPAGSLKSLKRLTLIHLKTLAALLMVLKAQNTAACYTQHNKIEQFSTFYTLLLFTFSSSALLSSEYLLLSVMDLSF